MKGVWAGDGSALNFWCVVVVSEVSGGSQLDFLAEEGIDVGEQGWAGVGSEQKVPGIGDDP